MRLRDLVSDVGPDSTTGEACMAWDIGADSGMRVRSVFRHCVN